MYSILQYNSNLIDNYKGMVMNFKNIASLFILICGVALAAPRPSLAPSADIWTIDVVYTQPKQFAVKSGNNQVERYWYIILSLVNNTGRDVPFYPKFELMTDTWDITSSDTGIVKGIYDSLKLMNQGSFPFMVTMDEVEHKILQGRDNSVDLLVVWKDFDLAAKGVKMFFAGFSNETAVVETQRDGQTIKHHLQKTLELAYSIPGDSKHRESQQLSFESKQWIMR